MKHTQIDKVVLLLMLFGATIGFVGGFCGGIISTSPSPESREAFAEAGYSNFDVFIFVIYYSIFLNGLCFSPFGLVFMALLAAIFNKFAGLIDGLFVLVTYFFVQFTSGVFFTVRYGIVALYTEDDPFTSALLAQITTATAITLIMIVGYIAFRRRAATYYEEWVLDDKDFP